MIFSEDVLKLQPRWFTGKEWADGTAERELQREYYEKSAIMGKIEACKTPEQKYRDKQKKRSRKFQKWFAYSLTKGDQNG